MYARATHGGLVGAAWGFGLTATSMLVLHRVSPLVRRLRLPFKAMIVTMGTSGGCVLQAEREILKFDRELYCADLEKNQLVTPQYQGSVIKEMRQYVQRNRWSIISGTWLGGMAASGVYLYRQRYMSASQKFVLARMYAQAITLFALLATAAVTAIGQDEDEVEESNAVGDTPRKQPYHPTKFH